MLRKNKTLFSVFSMALASLVLTFTAFASINTASGYDRYKKALINTVTNEKNYTAYINLSIFVDGTEEFATLNEVKNDGLNSMSTISTIKNGTETKSAKTISQGSQTIYLGEDDRWHLMNHRGYIDGGNPFASLTQTQIRFMELLADTLTGDTKNYIVTDGNTVSLTLSENQIPELSQLGLSSFIEIENKISLYQTSENIDYMIIDPIIQGFKFNATLGDDNVVKDTKVITEITYKDNENIPHKVDIYAEVSFENFGSTIPEKIDDEILNDLVID